MRWLKISINGVDMDYRKKLEYILDHSSMKSPLLAQEFGASYSTVRNWLGLDGKTTAPQSEIHKRLIDNLYVRILESGGGDDGQKEDVW